MTLPNIHELKTNKPVFFASDFHLGSPNAELSRQRERKIIRWLDHILPNTGALFLIGDIFDFWFEYRHAIPKGFIRFQGKLAEFSDRGIPLILFGGNHDMWLFDYFTKELNIEVYHHPQVWKINECLFYVAHGDGLGPGDYQYKFIKKVFRNPVCQWLFKRVHPDMGIGLAYYLSRKSRAQKEDKPEEFRGEQEWLWQYAREIEGKRHHDYYLFGHRHLPLDLEVGPNSRYINTGDWIRYFTYACFDGKTTTLQSFETSEKPQV